jgi:phage terminase large subunit
MFSLNPALREFWSTPSRHKILHGGRASSKSHDAAGMAVYLTSNFRLKFLCARQFQNRISESVYTLLEEKIYESDFKRDFVLTNNSIYNKITRSEFLFYGIARNLQEIRSTEGVDVLWLEEGHYLTEEQWGVVNPTIRKEGSEIWVIFNPDNYMDFIYQKFVVNTPEDTLVREINWPENPFLSNTMLKVISDAYRDDPDEAEYIYGGKPRMGQDKSVINLTYIMSAIDAHKKLGWEPAGVRSVGYDIADDGDDLNAIVEAHGNVIQHIEDWAGLEDQLLKSCTKVYNFALERGDGITYDSIGVGAHAGSKFAEMNEARNHTVQYDAFNAGGAIDNPEGVYMRLPHVDILNKDHFSNIKAQKWDEVATRFRKTHEAITAKEKGTICPHPFDEMVSIDSAAIPKKTMDKLKMELSAPRKDVDGNGRFKVESKKDMLARKIKSPNIADAFIMALIKAKRTPRGFFDY